MPELETLYANCILSDDGSIGPSEKEAFTQGHCHSFALALNDLTGWSIKGLVDDTRMDYDYKDKNGKRHVSPSHVVAYNPTVGYVDVYGRDALKRWREKGWRHAQPVDLTPEETRHHLEHYLDPEEDVALPYAKTLLKELHVAIPPAVTKQLKLKFKEAAL